MMVQGSDTSIIRDYFLLTFAKMKKGMHAYKCLFIKQQPFAKLRRECTLTTGKIPLFTLKDEKKKA